MMSSEIQEKGFLFGERTLSNIVPAVLPVIELIWGMRKEQRSP